MKPFLFKSTFRLFSGLLLISLSIFLTACNGSRSDHRGDTDMGGGGGRSAGFRGCDYFMTQKGQQLTLKITGEFIYEHGHKLELHDVQSTAYPPIVISPSVWEGSSPITNSYNISCYINDPTAALPPRPLESQGQNWPPTSCPGLQGFFIKAPDLAPFSGSAPYSFKTDLRFDIRIDNVSFGNHTYKIKFVFPFGGLDNGNGAKDCDSTWVSINVCALQLEDIKTTAEVIGDIAGPTITPEEALNKDWPRYQIFREEDQIILIPYDKDDFDQ